MFERKINFVLILLIAAMFPFSEIIAQKENRLIRKGNKSFEKSDFQQAEIEYRRALEKNNNSLKGEFNLGGALYEQENFDEAAKAFNRIAGQATEAQQRAEAFYNLGNTMMNLEDYEAAIEAFKNALRLNPEDFDSKYNLEYAMHQLREQQEQEQQQQNQDQDNNDQDNENQDQQNDQNEQQQEGENDQNEQQQQNNQEQSDNQSSQQDQPQQQNSQQISKEDAERMLQALREKEKNTLDKIKLEKLKDAQSVKTEKDW